MVVCFSLLMLINALQFFKVLFYVLKHVNENENSCYGKIMTPVSGFTTRTECKGGLIFLHRNHLPFLGFYSTGKIARSRIEYVLL